MRVEYNQRWDWDALVGYVERLEGRVRELEEAVNRFFDAYELANRTGWPVRITFVMQEAIDDMRKAVRRKDA